MSPSWWKVFALVGLLTLTFNIGVSLAVVTRCLWDTAVVVEEAGRGAGVDLLDLYL